MESKNQAQLFRDKQVERCGATTLLLHLSLNYQNNSPTVKWIYLYLFSYLDLILV
jgi:hypothetical protein